MEHARNTLSFMPGLDPGIHDEGRQMRSLHSPAHLRGLKDCRGKPEMTNEKLIRIPVVSAPEILAGSCPKLIALHPGDDH
jgi:hypothetical protein